MRQPALKCGFAAIMFALILGVHGCSRQAAPIEEKETITETEATQGVENNALEAEKPKSVLTPAQLGFPPEQLAPWVMTVSPEPLSPVTTANTGDFHGKWPEYSTPREIRITAPELPPRIEGPTLSTGEASLPANR